MRAKGAKAEAGRHASRLTGGAPRRAPAADGDAVAVEDQRAVGVGRGPCGPGMTDELRLVEKLDQPGEKAVPSLGNLAFPHDEDTPAH